ncbi:VOC family protein [Thalassospira alkalitolerans]|uniref:VOC family protein n=1 Tax=Thalassospira alkalitolerans TaxID=1293890 RepID=UPI003AA90DB3
MTDHAAPPCNRVVIYSKKPAEIARFYGELFGYRVITKDGDRIMELQPPNNGLILMLHPAGKGQKQGQSLIKLVFDVKDVDLFRQKLIEQGHAIGPVHQADGYQFANFRDPSGNPVSISSRAFVSD